MSVLASDSVPSALRAASGAAPAVGQRSVPFQLVGTTPCLCNSTPCCACCAVQVVLHPRWGSAVYPASLFARAPLEAVQRAIQETEAELRQQGLDQNPGQQ